MPHTKLSITLRPETAAELRRSAGPRGVSAFVNEAVQQMLQARRINALLAEMEAEVGPVPEAIQAEVEALDWPD